MFLPVPRNFSLGYQDPDQLERQVSRNGMEDLFAGLKYPVETWEAGV